MLGHVEANKKNIKTIHVLTRKKSDPLTAFVNLQAFVGAEIDGLAGQGGLRWNF